MSTLAFRPRACGDHAWKAWFKDAARLMRRSVGSWLAFSVLFTCGASLAVAQSGWAAWAGIVVLGPWFGVEIALAEALAQGTVSGRGMLRAAWADVTSHGHRYAQALVIRGVGAAALVAGYRTYHAGEPVGASWETGHHPLFVGSTIWLCLWFIVQAIRWDGCVGFYPWLRTKAALPLVLAMRLDARAYQENRHSLRVLQLFMLTLLVVGAGIPLFAAVASPFWACLLRCAYADIFRQGGLTSPAGETQESRASMKHDSLSPASSTSAS